MLYTSKRILTWSICNNLPICNNVFINVVVIVYGVYDNNLCGWNLDTNKKDFVADQIIKRLSLAVNNKTSTGIEVIIYEPVLIEQGEIEFFHSKLINTLEGTITD